MWAMIPMFRTRSSPTSVCVATFDISLFLRPDCLPAVVREGLVCLRHPVLIVLGLERAALLVQRVEELAGELLVHALLAPLARVFHDPAHSQCTSAALRH